MQNEQASLLTRGDTLFGVCEGLGEDLGFNSTFLRLALVPLLFFYPVAAISGYAVGGVVVLLSRLLFPNPRIATAEQPVAIAEDREALTAGKVEDLPLAA